ncbi:winged helix-turn-helix domain-containing protein [Micromonospora sp. RP3T]|uniref:winged helix-turn-helix domain-containing protein n=1 Tax=Micromonospora sp. RP3T TaxID=2135446 RepID=UPI001E430E81|nr:winged helix-turn-helix domain-containing protein [Micromonospora sp. RP3T]
MTVIPSLVIGIASTAAERRQLAQLLGGTETFLIVSSAHQARRFLDLVRRPPVTRPAVSPAPDSDVPADPRPGTPAPRADSRPGTPTPSVDPSAGSAGPPVGAPAGSPLDPSAGPSAGSSAGSPRDLSSDPPAGSPAEVTDRSPVDPSGPELAVDSDRRVLRWREREVGLTPLEHDLLVCLAGIPGQVWTYARLHRAVWGNDHLGRGSDMHSVVRRIRHKLARLNAPTTIHAVRGVGFRLTLS